MSARRCFAVEFIRHLRHCHPCKAALISSQPYPDSPTATRKTVAFARHASFFSFVAFANAIWMELEKSCVKVDRSHVHDENNPDNPEFGFNNVAVDLRQSAIAAWTYIQPRGFAIPSSPMFPRAVNHSRLELTKRGREWVDGNDDPTPE